MEKQATDTQRFITDDFLLQNEFARSLYHEYAKDLPIIDYHSHLPPGDIADDRTFANLTEVWLNGDHYKWRAMRAVGVPEKYITGDATDREKFQKWSYAVPFTVRNPLYHWTHLELQRYFGVSELLSSNTEEKIYNDCTEKLSGNSYSTRRLLERMRVEVVCSTDDPVDDLRHHRALASATPGVKVLPTFRPDRSYNFEDPAGYNRYLDTLGASAGTRIQNYDDLLTALKSRVDFFHAAGCRLSDHGLTNIPPQGGGNPDEIFLRVRTQKNISTDEKDILQRSILVELGKMYHTKGWVQQFHLGALRNTNARMMEKLGADSGFDSIGDFPQARSLAAFLNDLDKTNQLTRTILYNLNPADNEVFATMTGNFNDGSIKGKIQYGSAWWFLDQKDGMEKQLNTLSNLGVISTFIGMITDSRSFLSYPRHEYFRRILCNLIGKDVETGELPADEKWLGKIVADICYYNALNYFKF